MVISGVTRCQQVFSFKPVTHESLHPGSTAVRDMLTDREHFDSWQEGYGKLLERGAPESAIRRLLRSAKQLQD